MVMIHPSTDLNFTGQKGAYATHAMHSFSAKFPPQLPRWAMQEFTKRGDSVFDPFVGSGTTFVEAKLLGRNSYGAEIDPLSRLITKVKSTPIDTLILHRYTEEVAINISEWFAKWREKKDKHKGLEALRLDLVIPDFPNRDYWYYPETLEDLTLLLHLIKQVEHKDVRDFLYLTFSGIIYTKGLGSMANVRDLAHSRPHRVMKEKLPDVEKSFFTKMNRLRKMMENFWGHCDTSTESKIVSFDARAVPALKDNSIDLVFNSPPYVNAIDYQRGHKFSIFWLADVLDTSPEDYLALAKNYVGSDRIPKAICLEKISSKFNIPKIDQPVQSLAEKDHLKLSGIVYSYFESMKSCISEMLRVVKLGQPVIIVVGASNIKGVPVDTPEATAQLAETIQYSGTALKGIQIIERSLDRDRRQMPITRGIFGDGMKTEHIVVLEKVNV